MSIARLARLNAVLHFATSTRTLVSMTPARRSAGKIASELPA
jgi:hypothetical protein